MFKLSAETSKKRLLLREQLPRTWNSTCLLAE